MFLILYSKNKKKLANVKCSIYFIFVHFCFSFISFCSSNYLLLNLANMTLLWAQLIINDKSYGPHIFLVPIRDLKDHSPMAGVIIGDCGAKNGCNAIDNGFLIMKNCRIPRDNLLDKYSKVMSDGTFITDIPNPDKRYFNSFYFL